MYISETELSAISVELRNLRR